MKVQLTVHEQYKEIEVHVFTDAYTNEVEQLMKTLKSPKISMIDGYNATEIRMLKLEDIFTIYVEDGKVYFQTAEEEFESKRKLYELEALFEASFVKVNKSTLVNLSKIVSIQMGIVSTPQLLLDNETTIHISRKYFKLLKEKLMMGRENG
ncbi:LytTR family DNA-binding domain-containing protein [Lysinibacillus sp. KU-BSD001]|uniref:LytTR family DNA-binding domain-containing protein n=1 Tax=Lysinibacillus sp. KU-BSD001 TaxID=3141328 RepID=UPI0036F0D95E